jgi:predicted ATPase
MGTQPNKETPETVDSWTLPPFLRRVRIRGYKSIAFCDVPLQPLTILVGRNGAGKSNFLDALAFLRDAMETHVPEAVKRRGGWSSVVCRTSPPEKIEIEIEAGFTCGRPYQRISGNGIPRSLPPTTETLPNLEGNSFTARYRITCAARPHVAPTISEESLVITDDTNQLTAGFEASEEKVEARRSSGGISLPHTWELLSLARPDQPRLGMIGTQPFIDLGDRLRWMGFYNFRPDSIRTLQKPSPGWLLEKDGRNLASVIEGLKEINPDGVQRVRDYLANISEEVESFDVVRYGEYETVRFQQRSGPGGTRLEFDAASMSDGTLRALAALMAAFQIHLPTGPSVVGIEEPESALHPAATHTLVRALQEATQQTQVLLTTHSADLLAERDLDPAQVLVVRNRHGRTHITPVDPGSREIIRKELYSLADLQRMGQLDSDEADLQRQAQAQVEAGEE